MKVSLRGLYAEMAQEIFYVFYIGSFIQQVRGKTMPQAMYAHLFFDARLPFGIGENLLYGPGRIGPPMQHRFK